MPPPPRLPPHVRQALSKRKTNVLADRCLDLAFDKQRDFILDPCRFKAACCTRRAGKTLATGIYIFHTALSHPGCNVLYVAKSRGQAKNIVIKDVFGEIDQRLGGTGYVLNQAELTLTFPNGSVVHVTGADSSEESHQKLVGKKYKLVVIDEAQFFKTSLFNLIKSGLGPAMADVRGTICMIGVPDNAKNVFYDVATKQRSPKTGHLKWPGWSVHSWTAFDNPHMRSQWEEEIAEFKLNDPYFLDTPAFKQQYLGEWIDDPEARCYRFERDRNWVEELPGHVGDYTWVLGVDVGWHPDPMAFVVCGYRTDHSDPALYVVYSYKQTKMPLDDVKDHVDWLKSQWPISTYVIDGANANVVNELQLRFGIPFEKAQKHGDSDHQKRHYIEMMSNDLQTRRVKVVGTGADSLADEWLKLVWDRSDPVRPKEHSSCDNHCADAALYAWRRCFHYVQPAPKRQRGAGHDSVEWVEAYERRLMEEHSRQDDELSQLERVFKDI